MTQDLSPDPGLSRRVRGSGPWLVLIHSLATRGSAWDAHAPWLAERYRVLQYDVDAAPGCSLASLAADLHRRLYALGALRAHLVGISMGGMIAQQYAIDHPDSVLSLSLIATAGHNSPTVRQAWSARIALAREQGMQALVEPLLLRWFTAPFRATEPGLMTRFAELIRSTDVGGFAAAAAVVRDVDTLAALSRLRVPALVLAGAEDPATPPAMVERLADALAGARYRVVPDAAHWLPLQQPQRFRAELQGFLGALPP